LYKIKINMPNSHREVFVKLIIFLTILPEKAILAVTIFVITFNTLSFATDSKPESRLRPKWQNYDIIFHKSTVNCINLLFNSNLEPEYKVDLNKCSWNKSGQIEKEKFNYTKNKSNDHSGCNMLDGCIKTLILNNSKYFSYKIDPKTDEVLTDKSADQNIKVNDINPDTTLENPGKKNFLAASLEIGAILLAGDLAYYFNGKIIKKDYAFSTNETFMKRFTTTETLTFDTNPMQTNAVAHPIAGTAYYLIARSNGFNSMESFAFSFVSSAVWEYFCEFKEITSVNDMIVTPVGGMAFGESIYQFAAYFAADSSGFFSDFVNTWILDGRNYYRGAHVNGGFTSLVWNDMKLFTGGGTTDKNEEFINFGIDLEMYGIKRFNRSGKTSGVLFNGPYSKILLNSKINDYGLKEFQLYSETALIAYVNQHLHTEEDVTSGYAVYIGINSAFDYKKFKTGDFMDELGITHIAGPVADIFLKFMSAQIRMRLAAFGDFACVQSFGLAPYLDSHPNENLQNRGAYVTAEQGYYYGKGATADALISAQWKNFEIGSRFIYHHYNSLNVHQDRYPESNDPIKMKDVRSELKSWLQFNFPEVNEAVKFEYNRKFLKGSADGYYRSTVESCFNGSVLHRLI
jgi:hypothetical protein